MAVQPELFDKWVRLWLWVSLSAFPFGPLQRFQTKWVEMVGALLQRHNNLLAVQLQMGLGTIDKLLHLAEVKNAEELRRWTMELWQKAFDDLWLLSNAQMRRLQNAGDTLSTKDRAPADRTIAAPVASKTTPGPETGKIPGKPRSDKEQLKEALEEYEMTRGDWSKGH
jgi:hypothetical protein